MLQNARVIAFTVSELLRENRQGVKFPRTHLPTWIRINPSCPDGGMRGEGGIAHCARGVSLQTAEG